MRLNENDVNNCLQSLLGQNEDGFQQAWVEILESHPETFEEITPIIRRLRNKAIKQYWEKKSREVSLYKPIGKNGDETFTLESVLASPASENAAEQMDTGNTRLYSKIVNFLMNEYFRQKAENVELKRKEIDLKAERLRLREESLKFKKNRFELWRVLMEEKTKQKENQLKVRVQLQREKLEFRREQLRLKGGTRG
jgi:hypothetical protein